MTESGPSPAPPPLLDVGQIETIRAYHRGTRNAGLVACLVGVLAMIAGRFMAGAPIWLVSAGVGIVVLGWGLVALALWKRLALARSLTSKSSG